RFVCRWVDVRVETSVSPLSADLVAGEILRVPVKHGEGQFVASAGDLDRIERDGLVVFRYCSPEGTTGEPHNPNGASNEIAGVRNEAGNVVGLMPHPEHAGAPAAGAPAGPEAGRARGGVARAPRAGGRPGRRRDGRPADVRVIAVVLARPRLRRVSASGPLHRQLGLPDDELGSISSTLGRDPNPNELAMYAVMWSEHCSYKSSKVHLRKLPTEGPAVLVGPGQDAGAVDVGDGIAVVLKLGPPPNPRAAEPPRGPRPGSGGSCAT